MEGTNLSGAHLEGASLRGANLKNLRWPTNYGDYPVILPDGTVWTPEETNRLGRFTHENHLDYKATLAKINAIRVKLGCDPIK